MAKGEVRTTTLQSKDSCDVQAQDDFLVSLTNFYLDLRLFVLTDELKKV